MVEIIERLKQDFPNHDFAINEKETGNVLFIDEQETPITYSSAKNIIEDNEEDKKTAENALYEVLKIEVNKFFQE
jgi:hypothetical protein